MTDEEFHALVAKARAAYDRLSPEQKISHDYMQRRSYVRGMCPSTTPFNEWCTVVDEFLPPLTIGEVIQNDTSDAG